MTDITTKLWDELKERYLTYDCYGLSEKEAFDKWSQFQCGLMNKPDCTDQQPTEEEIREAFEKEALFSPWLKYAKYIELGLYLPISPKVYDKNITTKLNDCLDGFERGYKAQSAKLKEQADEIERLNTAIYEEMGPVDKYIEENKTLSSIISEAVEALKLINNKSVHCDIYDLKNIAKEALSKLKEGE